MTRISTACSWVNIRSPEMAAILPQVGYLYFGAVGQYYFGVNTRGDSKLHLRAHTSQIHFGTMILDTHGVKKLRPDALDGE